MRDREEVFPIAILTANRRILIVGGGKVAAAKLKRLKNFSWRLTVLSPEFHSDIQDLAEQGRIELRKSLYQEGDIHGYDLVFAATHDSSLNGRILAEARRRGIQCCAVDGNWNDGDFITPVIIQGRHGIAAFSSGGISRRVAMLMKSSLRHQMEAAEDWTPVVLGTSHHQINMKHREVVFSNSEEFFENGVQLGELRGVHEYMLLNTCNRIEFYGLASFQTVKSGLIHRLLGLDRLCPEEIYEYNGQAALPHLARVGAGLLSQTPGENHIVSQLKNALEEALSRGWAGPFMQDWLSKSLHVAKHIRGRISSYLKYDDLEDLVASFILKRSSEAPRILLLGTGEVGRSMAKELKKYKLFFTWAYHSKRPENSYGAPSYPMFDADLRTHAPYDILISALHLKDPLSVESFPEILKPGGMVVDLGVPHNLDTSWQENHELSDLEDLKYWYRREMADTQAIMDVAEEEISAHRKDYDRIISPL